jgi:hypothetical protein
MKQARQQAQDLRQTDEFLHTLVMQENSEKERANKPVITENSMPRQMNGRPKIPRFDSISRFSDPPAPPPQQPLPEKPDAPSRTAQEISHSSLKRSDTEKPLKPVPGSSPVSRESSQILSLIEALSSAKKELDAQGARVRELEDLLLQERSAREQAEEKVRVLENQSGRDRSELEAEYDAVEPPPDRDDEATTQEPESEKRADTDDICQSSDAESLDGLDKMASAPSPESSQLQQRLDEMMAEMVAMKQQVENFKTRAEKAEDETREARRSLAGMIETLRRDHEVAQPITRELEDGNLDSPGRELYAPNDQIARPSKVMDSIIPSKHTATPSHVKKLENAPTTLATHRHRHHLLEQSTPYASMLGVVLLGVGIMAYLNGWQKMDK